MNEREYIKETVRAWLTTTPKTQKELARLTGEHPRRVRMAIGLLRDEGVKVCSGNQGFWLWNGEDESWTRTKSTIKKKALSSLKRYYRMEGLPLEGQITFEEVAR